MIERDYSSNYKIKEFYLNEIAPKYLDLDEVNQYNVGLIGYTTEVMSTSAEDTFNALNIFMKETHASRATMPDTIYTNASIHSVDNIMGAPASIRGVLYIKEQDIIDKGAPIKDRIEFVFDSNAKIYVDGIYFSLDYDIIITARPFRGDYQFLSQYDMTYENSISKIAHPYIKTHRTLIYGERYILLEIELRQYVRTVLDENIINNDRINLPIIPLEYENQLAGIDILYKDPGGDTYILLEKRMEGTVPTSKPFYFYSIRDDGQIEISFTSREKYFQPKYNSDLKIILYTTTGTQGNFKEYTGGIGNIQIINDDPKNEYMRQIIPIIGVIGSSVGGQDALSIENVRALTVENMATSGAYNTEEDINLFLRNYTEINNLFITFIKKRDDLVERLFTGFMLFKDKYGDYFHTNTLNLKLFKGLFDFESEALDKYIIRPGRVFKYENTSRNTVVLEPQDVRSNNITDNKNEFVFTNPLLMVYQKKPNNIGYYINSINDILTLDFVHADINSPLQFVASALKIERNAINGDMKYKFTTKVMPTRPIEKLPDDSLETDDRLKIALTFEEKDGEETKALLLNYENYDEETNMFTFVGEIETDDIINSNEKIIVRGLYDLETANTNEQPVRMVDLVVNMNILYDTGTTNNSHNLTKVDDLANFTLVNKYATETNKANLIIPVNFMRSRTIYEQYVEDEVDGEAVMSYFLNVYQVPLLSAFHARDEESLMNFLNDIKLAYMHLLSIVTTKTSNYNIDLKFYNTYGRSLNFVVGEKQEVLDKTNITISIAVRPEVGVIVDDLFADIREYTKNYVENVNSNRSQNIGVRGYNAIYISNLTQELENEFNGLDHMVFNRINNYDSSIQTIENRTVDTKSLTASERRDYIPEFLTIRLEDIKIRQIAR